MQKCNDIINFHIKYDFTAEFAVMERFNHPSYGNVMLEHRLFEEIPPI